MKIYPICDVIVKKELWFLPSSPRNEPRFIYTVAVLKTRALAPLLHLRKTSADSSAACGVGGIGVVYL